MSLTVSELLALEGTLRPASAGGKARAAAGRTLVLCGGKMNISPSGSWAASWCLSPASTIPGMKPT